MSGSSDRTAVVDGNHFPPEDVDHAYLEFSVKQSVCRWKGRASYCDVIAGMTA